MSDLRQRALRDELLRAAAAGVPEHELAAAVFSLRHEFIDPWALRTLLDDLARDLGLERPQPQNQEVRP